MNAVICAAVNVQLTDLYTILDIQVAASVATRVTNNSLLCFVPWLRWAQRADSYLEYSLSKCPSLLCPLFEVAGDCVSQCSSCGSLCGAFPITDSDSLAIYNEKQCSIVSGDLYIMNLPSTVTKSDLAHAFQSIRSIRNVPGVMSNQFLSALTFMHDVVGVYGVQLLNNPILVDARMPNLTALSGDVTVDGCSRLCPARYPNAINGTSDSGCANSIVQYYLNVVGNVTTSDVSVLAGIMARVLSNVTSAQVVSTIS